jgi:hypothetical protein
MAMLYPVLVRDQEVTLAVFVIIFPPTFMFLVIFFSVIRCIAQKHKEKKERRRQHDFCVCVADFVRLNKSNTDLAFWQRSVLAISARYGYHEYTVMNQIRREEPELSRTMNQLYAYL